VIEFDSGFSRVRTPI